MALMDIEVMGKVGPPGPVFHKRWKVGNGMMTCVHRRKKKKGQPGLAIETNTEGEGGVTGKMTM